MKLQKLCGIDFCLFAVRMLAKRHHFGGNGQQHIANTMMGHISSTSILNAMIGKSCCAILKMVILHDAAKTIQNFKKLFLF